MKAENKVGVISFNVDGVHPHDVSTILDTYGIAIRAGHHCAQPFMKYMNLNSTCRISFYLYNTKEDVDIFIESIKKVRGYMGYES
ncbi:putative cysteine desulfurase [compost metagenome]